MCIRGDLLKTIANNEFSVFSHQFSVSFFSCQSSVFSFQSCFYLINISVNSCKLVVKCGSAFLILARSTSGVLLLEIFTSLDEIE